MRIAKWIIAVAVVVGLALAAQKAIEQWRAETKKIDARLSELDSQIAAATSQQERNELTSQRRELAKSSPQLSNLRWNLLLVACVLYAAGLVPPGMVLHRAVRSLGGEPRISTSLAAQLLGHLGKYVPGKAVVIVLRAGALRKDGVSARVATVSVFMETLLMMAVGATLAGIIICWLPLPRWIILSAVGVAIAASLPTLPAVFHRVAAKVSRADLQLSSAERWRLFLAGWAWSAISWVLIGGAFAVLLVAIPTSQELPPRLTVYAVGFATIAFAMVVGFASLLPGGAGMREIAITTILAPTFGPVHALLAAIGARIMFIVVEAIVATAAWLWLRTQKVE